MGLNGVQNQENECAVEGQQQFTAMLCGPLDLNSSKVISIVVKATKIIVQIIQLDINQKIDMPRPLCQDTTSLHFLTTNERSLGTLWQNNTLSLSMPKPQQKAVASSTFWMVKLFILGPALMSHCSSTDNRILGGSPVKMVPVCLSECMKQLENSWTDVYEIWNSRC
jgi:hypothetical protein